VEVHRGREATEIALETRDADDYMTPEIVRGRLRGLPVGAIYPLTARWFHR
jgi:hypothetical protein